MPTQRSPECNAGHQHSPELCSLCVPTEDVTQARISSLLRAPKEQSVVLSAHAGSAGVLPAGNARHWSVSQQKPPPRQRDENLHQTLCSEALQKLNCYQKGALHIPSFSTASQERARTPRSGVSNVQPQPGRRNSA